MGPYAMGSIWIHVDPYQTIWCHMDSIWAHMGPILWVPYGPIFCPGSSGARNFIEILDFDGIASGTIPLWGEGGRQPTAPDHTYIYIYIYR